MRSPAWKSLVLLLISLLGAGIWWRVAAAPIRSAAQEQDAARNDPGSPPAEKDSARKVEKKKSTGPRPGTRTTREPGRSGKSSEGPDPSASSQPFSERDRRLAEIEQQLQRLLDEIQALRRGSSAVSAETHTANAAGPQPLDEKWMQVLRWRAIGPANMGGRIVDLAVCPQDPSTFWVATASGGLLKTSNNGITFEHQFDHEATVSLGAVAVAPSDKNIVWVGTGEANPRNSVSYGDGVYKSTDGGKTWKNMGLRKSFQISRIFVHPQNPDVVYVGALGRLYGPNEERGLFKTTDGGTTWEKVLYVDERTGVIDAVMHPTDPETLVVAMWERLRDGFDSWPGSEVPIPEGYDGYDPITKWGTGGGLYKTTDGGRSFRKLSAGLPTSPTGRIGIDWQRGQSHSLWAVIDCESIGKGPAPFPAFLGVVGTDWDGQPRVTQVLPDSPAAKGGVQVGDVIVSVGSKPLQQFDELLEFLRAQKPGGKVELVLRRGEQHHSLTITLTGRPGSGAASTVWLGAAGEEREGRVELTQVMPGSPAGNAGLQPGDLVRSFAGQEVKTFEQLIEWVREKAAGDKVALVIESGGAKKEITLTLENRPGGPRGGAPSSQSSPAYLGIRGEDAPQGARLTQVTDDAPADKAGLKAGDVVQSIDGKKVNNYEELAGELARRQPDDKIVLGILRDQEKLEITATMEARAGGPSRIRPYSFSYGGQSPNIQDQQGAQGHLYGGIYRSEDGGETWQRVNSLNSRPMYFSVVKVDPNDDQHIYVLGVAQYASHNGGVTFSGDFGRGVHADGHALWTDPRDGRHMILGTDGGVYVTYDRGANWDHLNHAAIGQFYHVAISPKAPYYVTGGLQDNGTWFGPSHSLRGTGPINEDWSSVSGGDGFMCRVDPDDPDLVYYTSQNGAMGRRNLRTGERTSIRPQRPRGTPAHRFNWNAPFILSHHNSRIFYCAGNYVFRSLDRGNNLQAISPEITLTKRGSATALAESPRDPNVLYVGTDDGALWVTRDNGQKWTDITKNLGLKSPRWIATIEPSRFADGRVYVCCDGHRSDDDEPYVFVSDDFGETFQSLRGNLAWGSTRCLREDRVNANLLYLGTEFGAWCSVDRGQAWTRFNNNLPTVAVHEIALHPTNGELVAATHGRSLWITDVTPLRELTVDKLDSQVLLCAPAPATRWLPEPTRGRTNRRFAGTNPPAGATLYYSLPKKANQVSLRIEDIQGTTLRELRGPAEPGLHQVVWDLTRTPPRPTRASGSESASGRGRPPFAGRGGPGRSAAGGAPSPPAGTPSPDQPMPGEGTEEEQENAAAAPPPAQPGTPAVPPADPRRTGGPGGAGGGNRIVAPGTFRVVLTVDGQEHTQTLRVDADPNLPPGQVMEEEDIEVGGGEEEEEEEEEEERESVRGRDID